ncbi:MAG: methanogenesis marker 16 metalloprotein, partial [Deltaproteobacteria bacterium]
PKDVDVVTTATCGVMSGTAAILSIPIEGPGKFKGVQEISLNDVPAFPGPCPNENLGIVEAILYGTTPSKKDPKRYGGGHVFYDLVSGKSIKVKIKTNEGDVIEAAIGLKDLEFARMFTTRACFKNYLAMINTKPGVIETIFSVQGLKGPYREVTVSGCGELNPLENDRYLKTIGIGTKILLNGAIGYIMGKGTRSSSKKPNLTLSGDMQAMKPEFMGGVITGHTPDCMTSVAIPIPVVDEEIFENLKIQDEQIELPVVDIHDRSPIAKANYGNVWQGKDLKIIFNEKVCASCTFREKCFVEEICPSASFKKDKGIDSKKCFNCGACVFACPEHAFQANLGTIKIHDREVPITLRQSNRIRAEKLASELKSLIYEGYFTLTPKVADINLGR